MERLAQGFDGRKNAVAEFVFDQVPELLAGIVLGTVGRQVDDTHVGGKPRIPVPEMEARLVAAPGYGRSRDPVRRDPRGSSRRSPD